MSTQLSRANGYRFPPAPAPAIFGREEANFIHGDIHQRLLGLEGRKDELEALITELRAFGLERLDTAIIPLIEETTAELVGLRAEVEATLAANSSIIENFQSVTAVNLEELENKIDQVEARVTTILAGGLDAADVRESSTRVFLSPAERDEIATIAEVRSSVTTLAASTHERFQAADGKIEAVQAEILRLRAYSLFIGGRR